MLPNKRASRSAWVKPVLLGLLCLLVGLAIGRWLIGRKAEGDRTWHEVEELHHMYIVPSSYNFVESNKSYENQLLSLLHDHLLHYDPVRDQLVSGLARTYEASSDGLTWTFHLREAQTPDGERLSADDVVFSFNLCLDKRFDCKRRGYFILNKKPIEATAIDSRTVSFRLSEPFHSFPWAISSVFIVPKAVFAPVVGDEKALRQAVGVQQPELKYLRGFGPYFVESRDTQEVRLVRNEKFWDRGEEPMPRPRLGRLTLVLYKEGVISDQDFLRDDRYVYRLIGPMEAENLRDNVHFQILDRGRSGACMSFWLNQNPRAPWAQTHPKRMELFQKVEFRRALGHALDRQAIILRAYNGYAEPLYGPVSPVFRWAAPLEVLQEVTPKHDATAALTELAKLGITPGEPDRDGKRWLTYEEKGGRAPLEIEIRTSKDQEDHRRRTAEEIKSQLEEIGVRVKVVEERFGDVVMRLDKTFDYEASVMSLEGTPDATTLKHYFESSGAMHFVNPYQKAPVTEWERRVDELFKRFTSSADPAERDRALIDLQKTWVAAQPAFHLLNDRKLVAVRRDCEINGLALTGRAGDPILQRTIVENVRLRRLAPR